jgi:hypothetical protein
MSSGRLWPGFKDCSNIGSGQYGDFPEEATDISTALFTSICAMPSLCGCQRNIFSALKFFTE